MSADCALYKVWHLIICQQDKAAALQAAIARNLMEHNRQCAVPKCAVSVPLPLYDAHSSVVIDLMSVWQAGLIQALAKLLRQGGMGGEVREAVSEALKHLTASSQKNRDTLVACQVLPLIIAHLQTGDPNKLMCSTRACCPALLPWPSLTTLSATALPSCLVLACLHAVVWVH